MQSISTIGLDIAKSVFKCMALGHTVRLMPPAYVKPYVKTAEERHHGRRGDLRSGHKAEHAVRADQDGRATGCLVLLFIRQQTAVINSIRAHLAELGIVAPVGRRGVEQLLEVFADTADRRLPEVARACLLLSAVSCEH